MGRRRSLVPNRNRADQTQPRTNRGCQREARFISNPVYSGPFPGTQVPLAGNCQFECLFVFPVYFARLHACSVGNNLRSIRIVSEAEQHQEDGWASPGRERQDLLLSYPRPWSLRTPLAAARLPHLSAAQPRDSMS